MKTSLILFAFGISFACNHKRIPGEWEVLPNQYKLDSGFVEGRIQYFEQAVVSRNWVCPDSAIKAREDSLKSSHKK